jgi:hypothetical protein
MFTFNAAVMGFGHATWMSEVIDCFDPIIQNVTDPSRMQQECDVCLLRISKVARTSVNLSEYKSCMLASLRSLLPNTWDNGHEVAWSWLWENVERLLRANMGSPPIWEKALVRLLESMDEDQKIEVCKDIFMKFFQVCPISQNYFKQSNANLYHILLKVMSMTLEIFQDPVGMSDFISALGLRHVGYGIPTDLIGPFVTVTIEVLMPLCKDRTFVEAVRWSLGLISKMLIATIIEGSTIVMTAINNNTQKSMRKAIACAARGERAKWMLLVQVGSQSISPLAWALESGALESAAAIIKDLLTIRADRDRYYYGVDDIFRRHPDIIEMLTKNAVDLLPMFLTGLTWRSRLTEMGQRRVNFFVKHLIFTAEDEYSDALHWISSTADPKLVCHPVVTFIADTLWIRVAYRIFLFRKTWFLFTMVIFISSQAVLKYIDAIPDLALRNTVFAFRCFIYLLSMSQLIYFHVSRSIVAFRDGDLTKIGCMPTPRYLTQWLDTASFSLLCCLLVMLWLEPIFWCYTAKSSEGKAFNANCPEQEGLIFMYSVVGMFAMYLYFIRLLDLAVFSTRVSAFVFVCFRMISEVRLFLGALASLIVTFSCAMSALEHGAEDFETLFKASMSLFSMTVRTYSTASFNELHEELLVLIGVLVFLFVTVVFLLNMLIAQITCSYQSIYGDMVGTAHLNRIKIINGAVPAVSQRRWERFVASMHFDKRLEFNPGDVGLAGGVQIKEPASANLVQVDQIKRFGGSTSPLIQWPEEADEEAEEDRFQRIENLIEKTMKRLDKVLRDGKQGGGHVGSSTDNRSESIMSPMSPKGKMDSGMSG